MRASFVLALIAGLSVPAAAWAEAELLSVYQWERPEPYFGGMSGIDIMADGRSYVAIGDNGQILKGQIRREGGRIVGATSRWIGGLRTSTGQRVDRNLADSEGIALLQDGSFYVSFERQARVWKYGDWEANAFPLPIGPGFRSMSHNAALEAVAIDAKGRVYTMPERPLVDGAGYPVFVFDGQSWRVAGRIKGDASWRIVGADFDGRNRLYVLERRVRVPFGFASRVRRFDRVSDAMAGEVVLETRPGLHDNLEGLAVWVDRAGATRLLMVSDDNYLRFQRTELVEYRLTD